ncbi:MAG TPA: hypothetical protein V6D00_10560 [Pantanalinema sp.]
MKRLALGLVLLTAIAGCDAALLKQLGLGPKPGPTQPNDEDCFVTVDKPAAVFHVGAPATASVQASVSLVPWIFLEAPALTIDKPLPGTFKATVDDQAKTITVSGLMKRVLPRPGAQCAMPAMYMIPQAATLSVPVTLAATGTYEIRIAPESFTTQRPPEMAHPAEPLRQYPAAMATRSIVVE